MRILIAEDDEALAKFVRQGLEAEHYTVDIYADGEQEEGIDRLNALVVDPQVDAISPQLRAEQVPVDDTEVVNEVLLEMRR